MTPRAKRLFLWGGAVLVLFTALSCVGIWVPGLEVAFTLATGWVRYLGRVVPRVTVRWDLLATAAGYLAALAVGAHWFLGWLYRETRRADGAPPPSAAAAWKWRWTLGGLALVLLMFVAGTAMVGITHQAAWLARSPQPMYRRGNAVRDQIRCSSNLRQIGQALQMYTQANNGRFPDDLRPLVLGDFLEREVFVCPGSDDEFPPGNTAQEFAEGLLKAGHNSYVYLGNGIAGAAEPKRVVLVEPLENHEGSGMNVLYADGTTKFLARPEAEKVLESLGFERVELPPTR